MNYAGAKHAPLILLVKSQCLVWLICCWIIIMPTQLKLEAPWEEVKEKLKEVNTDLTDEDLVYQPGQEQDMLNRLAKKLHRSTEAVKVWIESVSFNKGKAS